MAACAGSGADDDVWFKFVATYSTHDFEVLNVTAVQGEQYVIRTSTVPIKY
jgi:hypothetical protein